MLGKKPRCVGYLPPIKLRQGCRAALQYLTALHYTHVSKMSMFNLSSSPPIAGYVPGSNVAASNKIDLDQLAMEGMLTDGNWKAAIHWYSNGELPLPSSPGSKDKFRAPACERCCLGLATTHGAVACDARPPAWGWPGAAPRTPGGAPSPPRRPPVVARGLMLLPPFAKRSHASRAPFTRRRAA